MIKRTFRVDGMTCPNCVMRVESIEDDLPGVKQVSASYQRGRMIVEFDETLVGEAEIFAAVKKAGYTAEAL
ncbi:MAG: heavy-metal-associated domain-containing protein [Chloroflexi bacterium]|nr:heavy-metal-associated domain-containing protein [Chloroflexota bacterium]